MHRPALSAIRIASALVLAFVVAACADTAALSGPHAPPVHGGNPPPATAPAPLARVDCEVTVRTGAIQCGAARATDGEGGAAGAGPSAGDVFGGQGTYVQLTGTNAS